MKIIEYKIKILNWCGKLADCISCSPRNRADHKLWSFKGISIDLLYLMLKEKYSWREGDWRFSFMPCWILYHSLWVQSHILMAFWERTNDFLAINPAKNVCIMVDMNFSGKTLVTFLSWNLYSSRIVVLISVQYLDVKCVDPTVNSQSPTPPPPTTRGRPPPGKSNGDIANGSQLLC